MFTIGWTVSTSDNDQVKAAGKDYGNVKRYTIKYAHTVNVNLMLICIELSKT